MRQDVGDANLALESAKEINIDGRVARTEKARAPCEYFSPEHTNLVLICTIGLVALSRHDGIRVTEDEARELLQSYGPLVQCYPITEQNAGEIHEAVGGMWAQFAYFSDCRD